MATRSRAYYRPADLPDAVARLHDESAEAAPLLIGPRPPVGVFPDRPQLVDVLPLNLGEVTEAEAGRLSLGAGLSLQALIEHPRLNSLADGVLAEAARLAAHLGLRHVATLGGLLLGQAGPPEVELVLLALDAMVVTLGQTRQATPLAHFRPAPGDLPIAVTVAASARQHAALVRVARSPLDQAIVAAVAVLTVADGLCQEARLAVAGAGPRPFCLTAAQLGLAGQAWTPARGAAAAQAAQAAGEPAGDYKGSAEYRRAMAGVLAGRALAEAWRRAQS